jgi:hypothetical protein
MNANASVDTLTNSQALWAVDYVGRAIAAAHHTGPSVLAARVRALDGFDPNAVPVIVAGKVAGGPDAEARAGLIARFALRAGLEDSREEVRIAVATAIAEATEPEVPKELVTIFLIGSALVFGLAVLSKLEVTSDHKIILHKGLPDIEKAGEAVGKLINAAVGGGEGKNSQKSTKPKK